MEINYIVIFNFIRILIHMFFSNVFISMFNLYYFFICFDFGAQGFEGKNIPYKTFPEN